MKIKSTASLPCCGSMAKNTLCTFSRFKTNLALPALSRESHKQYLAYFNTIHIGFPEVNRPIIIKCILYGYSNDTSGDKASTVYYTHSKNSWRSYLGYSFLPYNRCCPIFDRTFWFADSNSLTLSFSSIR